LIIHAIADRLPMIDGLGQSIVAASRQSSAR
jgi:hypothetical protein